MDTFHRLYSLFRQSTGVSIDTRTLSKGNLFFAIKGDRFDGNEYAIKALDSGALAAVVDDEKVAGKHQGCFLVEDSLQMLQRLANHYRRQLDAIFLAITGSNGKTTTKELIYHVLNQQFNTAVTKGNLNNHIGVPLTLLSVRESCEIAVIEMGANHQQEIAFLAELAEPNVGLITNIGRAHMEGFGGVEGIRKGKSELYRFLQKRDGKIFYNVDEDSLQGLMDPEYTEVVHYGLGKTDWQEYSIELIREVPFLELQIEDQNEQLTIQTNLFGKYNLGNISTAIAIGRYYGLTWDKIKVGIESYIPQNNRSQVVVKGSNTFVFDAYNANPTSMKAAIDAFSGTDHPDKVLILGEMLELGPWSQQAHKELIDTLRAGKWSAIYLIGEEFEQAAKGAEHIEYYPNTNSFLEDFQKQEWEGFAFLVKGSRRVGLDLLLEHLS